jgi:hypothetical protein
MAPSLKRRERPEARRRSPAARHPESHAPEAPPAEPGARWREALPAAFLAAALGAWTFRGSLRYGFSQDDWTGLARAGGLAERLAPGWRWLSHQAFWDLVAGPLHANAAAAHALVLAAHALSSALLVLLLARRLGAPAALIGGAFFATHFAQFTALYWLSANGDVVATLLGLAAVWAFIERGPRRWSAAPLFLLALLAKESVLGLPLKLAAISAFMPYRGRLHAPWRDPLVWALIGISLAWFVILRPGQQGAALGDVAYAVDARAAFPNLLTYAGWTLNSWLPTVRDIGDRVSPAEFGWALALLGTWIGACVVPALRERGAGAALAAFVAMLGPVLPLAAHTYHYYLVAGLPSAALLGSAIADTVFGRVPRAAAWTAAVAVAAVLAVNGGALADRMEHAPFKAEGLRADPVVDRALIAANALADLRAADLPAGAALRLWSPQAQAMAASEGVPTDREGYYETNLRTALAGGLAVRVALPQVASASFARTFDPADSLAWWAVCRYDGRLRVLRAGELASTIAAAR